MLATIDRRLLWESVLRLLLEEGCVWDLESNGLLPWQVPEGASHITTMHCAWIYDIKTGVYTGYRKDELLQFIKDLARFKARVGHNTIGYDEQVLEYIFGDLWTDIRPADSIVVDTLLLVKMLFPADDLIDRDMRLFHQGRLAAKLIKRQSLEAWGARLGILKGDYSENRKKLYLEQGGDPKDKEAILAFTWGEFNEDMFDYNRQDVVVNVAILELCLRKLGWAYLKEGEKPDLVWSTNSVYVEHRSHEILIAQQMHGFGFDEPAARVLEGTLLNLKAGLEVKLIEAFGSWWQPAGDIERGTLIPKGRKVKQVHLPNVTIRKFSEKTGKELKPYVGPPLAEYVEGGYHVPIKRVTFNPSSRAHLGNRLVTLFGWVPEHFGGKDGKQPQVDEGSIKSIPEDVLEPVLRQLILDYFKVDKALGQLSNGKKSWLNNFRPSTGAIHHRCDGLGTITHRGTHDDPNVGQTPAVSVDEKKDAAGKVISKTPIMGLPGGFGWEVRSLWVPRSKGWFQVGTDANALELRCLGHYLALWDDGAFSRRISDTSIDIHNENARITGLTRAATKTVTYAFLYGGGPLRIGQAVGVTEEEIEALWNHKSVKSWIAFTKRRLGAAWVEPDKKTRAQYAKGRQVIQKFLEGIDGLAHLKEGTSKAADGRGWVKGIDGRKIVTRKAHASLNSLLQSCGAIIAKWWMVFLHDMLESAGLHIGKDWNQMAWVHDELQIEARTEEIAHRIGKLSDVAMKAAGEFLGFRCDLLASYSVGGSWAETH